MKKNLDFPQSHPENRPSLPGSEGRYVLEHKPVMLNEALEYLQVIQDGIYLDATFGRGGHAKEILARLGDQGRLLLMDKDPAAIAVANSIKDSRVIVKQGSFDKLANWVDELELRGKIDGILLDLGVSSPQLDDPERGFSFRNDGPLDMRMDLNQSLTAAKWLNYAKEQEIAKVFKEFGQERYYRKLANMIIQKRKETKISTTKQLAELIASAIPNYEKGKHPATRIFQAIRIFINNELHELELCLDGAFQALRTGGRLVVISFHSLEYTTVKDFIKKFTNLHQSLRHLPFTGEFLPKAKLVKRLLRPSAFEVRDNPRARSAMMQVVEKSI